MGGRYRMGLTQMRVFQGNARPVRAKILKHVLFLG